MAFLFTCQLLLAWLALLCLVQAQIAEPASGDLPHIPLLYPHDLERFVKAHEKTAVTCTRPSILWWSSADISHSLYFLRLPLQADAGRRGAGKGSEPSERDGYSIRFR